MFKWHSFGRTAGGGLRFKMLWLIVQIWIKWTVSGWHLFRSILRKARTPARNNIQIQLYRVNTGSILSTICLTPLRRNEDDGSWRGSYTSLCTRGNPFSIQPVDLWKHCKRQSPIKPTNITRRMVSVLSLHYSSVGLILFFYSIKLVVLKVW